MKHLALLFTVLASSVASAAASAAPAAMFTYSNPLPFPGADLHNELRDPCIIRDGDHYYLVFTMWPFTDISSKDPAKPDNNSSPGIEMFVSKDLTNWKPLDWLVKYSDLPDDCPYKGRFWAPEIHRGHDGRFYLIFYADNWVDSKYDGDGKPGYHAFIGVSNKVEGPYEHISYLADSACDTTIFFDADGRVYSYMPFRDMYAQELDLSQIDSGKIGYIGPRVKVLSADNSDIGQPSPRYLEGPWAMKVGHRYYLFYAETYPDAYQTGVAYADSPMGPWTKDPRGKIFWGGHLAVFTGPDARNWFSYREEEYPQYRGKLCIDPMDIDAAGNIQSIGPTIGPQEVPVK
jgi:xylan 1,4-beta-xylosidase